MSKVGKELIAVGDLFSFSRGIPHRELYWYIHIVGFINPGSLMDRLPSKGSAQQTTLRTTQLLDRPKHLNNRPEGQSNLRPGGLAEEERCPLPTPALLSDRKASQRRNNARFQHQPPLDNLFDQKP